MRNSSVQFLIILVLGSICLGSICLESFGQEKLTKEEKKAKRETKFKQAKETSLAVAQTQRWVLESGIVYDRSGQSYIMNPILNFVMLDGEHTTIQLDFGALVGWNGVGGVTFDGKVSKFEIDEGKENKPFIIKIRSQGAVQGSVDLDFTVSTADNVRCNARGTWGDRLTLTGRLVPLEESVVYKGMSFK